MKVGMIFECGPHGPDQQVCEYLAQKLAPAIEISSVTLDNKPNLVSECGEAATLLLNAGCDRVVIVWDLYPPWREQGERPCRKEDREAIFQSLAQADVTSSCVYLVCIREELEAWLLADERAISDVLSRPTHSVSLNRIRGTERVSNPKKRLNRIFKEHSGRRYNDMIHARKIVKRLPDFNRIRRCSTFARFALKVADIALE